MKAEAYPFNASRLRKILIFSQAYFVKIFFCVNISRLDCTILNLLIVLTTSKIKKRECHIVYICYYLSLEQCFGAIRK